MDKKFIKNFDINYNNVEDAIERLKLFGINLEEIKKTGNSIENFLYCFKFPNGQIGEVYLDYFIRNKNLANFGNIFSSTRYKKSGKFPKLEVYFDNLFFVPIIEVFKKNFYIKIINGDKKLAAIAFDVLNRNLNCGILHDYVIDLIMDF